MTKRYAVISLLLFGTTIPVDGIAAVDYVNSDVDNFLVFNDTVIADSVNVENMNVLFSSVITNNGNISGSIDVCSGCQVYLQNRGNISAAFNVPSSSNVIQLIQDNSDVTKIGLSDFDVLVENAERVSWTGIQSISGNADKIILHNAGLELGSNGANTSGDAEIELQGDVILYLNDSFVASDVPVLSNVSGDGMIRVESGDDNSLYRFYSYISDGAVYVNMVRDKDYSRIFKNQTGKFLNNLRSSHSGSRLLSVLDSAESLSELGAVMNDSIRLNPVRLINPVRLMNLVEINNFNPEKNGISVSPVFTSFDDLSAIGGRVDAGYSFKSGLNIGASLYANRTRFSDKYEEYKSALYGGNVHIAYFYKYLFADVMAGATVADFDIGQVLYNNSIVDDPDGISFYSLADLGAKFNITSEMSVLPFARAVFDSVKVIDSYQNDIYYGFGAKLNFASKGYDIAYKYGLDIVAYNNMQFATSVYVDITSVTDNTGGVIKAGLIRDDSGVFGYTAQVGLRYNF